jgi:hypothetical protein
MDDPYYCPCNGDGYCESCGNGETRSAPQPDQLVGDDH